MEYRKITVSENDPYLKELVALSKMWADEHTCPAYYENEPNAFIGHEVYIAADQGRIAAYAMGTISMLDKKTSYNEIGEKAFELDEIYVAPDYRKRGIGKALYRFVEEDVRDKADVISVIATSYEHERLLKFYVDDLDMNFNYAFLVKRTHE